MAGSVLFTALLAALLAAGPSTAKITDSAIHADTRTIIPLAEGFGFATAAGHLDFTLSDVVVFHPQGSTEQPDVANMGFVLSAEPYEELDWGMEEEMVDGTWDAECRLMLKGLLPKFSDWTVQKVRDTPGEVAAYNISVPEGGEFYFYFINCEHSVPVSFSTHVEMYNDWGGHRNYLSAGEMSLEAVYWVMFGLFTLITAAWFYWVHRCKAYALRIHLLMGGLGTFKALTLMSQALMLHFMAKTGHPDGWNVVFYIFTMFRGVLFFTVVILIGTGWSYMKPFLGDKEQRLLMVVIPLQVFANIALVVMDEESPAVLDWFTWRDLFHLVDILCCAAVLFPIVWSMRNLGEAAHADGKAARNLYKLSLFRQFYVLVVVYIYFTRIVVYLIKTSVSYQNVWVADVAEQMATLAFYVWTGWQFSPTETNPYLRVESNDIEMS